MKEIKNIIMPSTLVSTSLAAKQNYSTMLFERIYQDLKAKDVDVESVVMFMDHYNISPAILADHITSLQSAGRENLLKDVPTQTKTKLTKTYNKHHEMARLKKTKGKNTGNNG